MLSPHDLQVLAALTRIFSEDPKQEIESEEKATGNVKNVPLGEILESIKAKLTGKGGAKAVDGKELEKLRDALGELTERLKKAEAQLENHDQEIEGINETLDELEGEKPKGKEKSEPKTATTPATTAIGKGKKPTKAERPKPPVD